MRDVTREMEHNDLGGGLYHVSKPSWSSEFASRSFHRASENQTYVDFLRDLVRSTIVETQNEDSDRESGGCWLGSEDEPRESDDESEDDVTKDEVVDEAADEVDDVEIPDDNIVEFFMNGSEGEEKLLAYPDQAEFVGTFCKRARLEDLPHKASGTGAAAVSLLYDSNSAIGIFQGKNQRLTPWELHRALSEKRYQLESNTGTTATTKKKGQWDVERRLLFSANPDCWVILAIAATAPRSQAPALKNFFYNYLSARTSLSITIPSDGFKTFTFDLHLSYYSFHRNSSTQGSHDSLYGTPSRRCTALPSYNGNITSRASTADDDSSDVEYMQETQVSFCLSGIDHQNWTVYAFVDAGPNSQDKITRYYDTQKSGFLPDPAAAGLLPVHDPVYQNPREYFLKLFEIRIRLILREWHHAETWAIKEVKQVGPMPFSHELGPINDELVRDLSEWVNEMGKTLRLFRNKLSETIEAQHAFNRHGLSYFLAEDGVPTTSTCLKRSRVGIDGCFSDLRAVLSSLEAQAHIVDEIRVSVSTHLSLENHSATVFQQRTAGHVKVLTVITIVFQPLVLTQGLFSTQGVLPFKPTLPSFIYALLFAALLVGFTSAILFNWDRWYHSLELLATFMWIRLKPSLPIRKKSRRKRKSHIDSAEGQNKADLDTGIATSIRRRRPIILRRIFRRHRRRDRDLEMGMGASEHG